MKEFGIGAIILAIGIGIFWVIVIGLIYIYQPVKLHVYEVSGKAQLIEAEQSRLIIIEEAKAQREASILNATAERDSAKLRAEAISIIGAKAKEFPEYRTQEFIGAFAEALKEGKISQIMYVPTEANIPITEAGKR